MLFVRERLQVFGRIFHYKGLYNMIARVLKLFFIVFLLAPTFSKVKADSRSDWIQSEVATFRLISSVSNVGTKLEIPIGLQFKMHKGWKIYWRHPGQAGFPPSLFIKNSSNLHGTTWKWPIPRRFALDGIESLGYQDEVVIPITLALKEIGEPVTIQAKLSALACKEICVPIEGDVSLRITSGIAKATEFSEIIQYYTNQVPSIKSWHGFKLKSIKFEENRIRLTIYSESAFLKPDVFIETQNGTLFGKPEVSFFDENHGAELLVSSDQPETIALEDSKIVMTFTDTDRFNEIRSVGSRIPKQFEIPVEFQQSKLTWLSILGIALLGGVLLNFMPCVLPVLTIKLLNVSRASARDQKFIRLGFLFSALGVIVSFISLAFFSIFLRKSGFFVTWGMQFQQPIFITISTTILLFFAANLFGLVKLRTPDGLIKLLPESFGSVTTIPSPKFLFSQFSTGIFATLLATPCSAPFVGTALTFALGGGATEIFFIFLVMGLGLASPYFLISLFPSALHFLPKPGAWMRKLEIFLGILLVLTAVWLIAVLEEQLPFTQLLMVIFFLLAAVASISISRLYKTRFIWGLSAGLVFLTVFSSGYPAFLQKKSDGNAQDHMFMSKNVAGKWLNFHPNLIREYVSQGKTVIVDVTADWCINCKVNEKLFLSRGLIADAISNNQLIGIRADWTKSDTQIAEYLHSFGRYGIPFNVIYGPSAPQGFPLPELLTETAIRNALKSANYNN